MAVHDVTDHGAAADGRRDDTAAIQSALDAADAAGGGVVYLPAGEYLLTSELTLHPHISLSGDGDQVSVLRQANPAAGGLRGVDVNFVEVSDVQLAGPGQDCGGGPGVHLTRESEPNLYGITLRDVYVREFGDCGVALNRPIVSSVRHVVCEANGAHGFSLHNTGTSCELAACYAAGNGGAGYRLDGMAYCWLGACAADSNQIGYDLAGARAISFDGCGAEDSPVGWKIDGGLGAALAACYVWRNAGRAYWVTGGAQGVTLTSCVEDDPAPVATASFQVDPGCRTVLIAAARATPASLAPGAVTEI